VRDFAKDEQDSGLSVKLVINGTEKYKIGDRTHAIQSGRFLVVNQHQSFQCHVHAKADVEGMCFYIDPTAAEEVYQLHAMGHRRILDAEGKSQQPLPQARFTEKIFALSETTLGHYLQAMLPVLRDPAQRQRIDYQSFFVTLAERLVESQYQTNLLINNLGNEKASTREELYRRMSIARNYIEEHYLQEISLDQLASLAMTSKYHFLRCFKEIYRCSPYQYVLQKRLQHGAQLLFEKGNSLTEVALETGFTDRRAFNKAFKKAFGVLPSTYKEDRSQKSIHV
jgi:AraC family transcriptional regulator